MQPEDARARVVVAGVAAKPEQVRAPNPPRPSPPKAGREGRGVNHPFTRGLICMRAPILEKQQLRNDDVAPSLKPHRPACVAVELDSRPKALGRPGEERLGQRAVVTRARRRASADAARVASRVTRQLQPTSPAWHLPGHGGVVRASAASDKPGHRPSIHGHRRRGLQKTRTPRRRRERRDWTH